MVDDVRAFFAGRLLVASPQIEEETFRRSVVLLLHHDEDGAQGVILNRPIEADIDAVLPGWKDIASSPQTMFQGGPVELNSAIGLVTVPGDEPEPLVRTRDLERDGGDRTCVGVVGCPQRFRRGGLVAKLARTRRTVGWVFSSRRWTAEAGRR